MHNICIYENVIIKIVTFFNSMIFHIQIKIQNINIQLKQNYLEINFDTHVTKKKEEIKQKKQ